MISTRAIIFLIIGMTFASYATALFNGFLGDDHVLFSGNSFYKDFSNLPKLLSSEYIIKFTDIDIASQTHERSFTGGVSYRPVSALSLFISYFLWKDNPAGYHLEGILMHILITLLVYYLIFLISPSKPLALMTSLIFATHPINTEVVNVMSYRSDLFSLLFYLLSFVSYIRYRLAANSRKGNLAASFLFYGMALFSKENAVTLPLMLVAYDLLFSEKESWQELLKKQKWIYLWFLTFLAFYLYVYLFVFPNANAPLVFRVGENCIVRLLVAGKIFYSYLITFAWPFHITVLPPLYAPAVSSIEIYQLVLTAIFVITSIVFCLRYGKTFPTPAFALIWVLITYLPTSNIIPGPNPYAFRFMYLPVIGLCLILALGMEKMAAALNQRIPMPHARWILLLVFVGTNMTITLPQNMFYKNNLSACQEMIRNYPDSSRPYWVLGVTYLNLGQHQKARGHFQKYLEVSRSNPFVEVMDQDYFIHHMLGRTYVDNPPRAIAEYKMALRLRPDYVHPLLDLALAHIQKKDYPVAIDYALKLIGRRKSLLGYLCAIYGYMESGELSHARDLLKKALAIFPGNRYLQHYERLISQKQSGQK